MTIVGIGVDVCDARRFKRSTLFSLGSRQTNMERTRLAKEWAIREAVAKALGTGFKHGVTGDRIYIGHNGLGAPEVMLIEGAADRLEELTGERQSHRCVHVSVTYEAPYATAMVVIEKKEN